MNGSAIAYGYQYDNLNRLIQVQNGNVTQQENYAYDPLGNRTSKTINATTPSVTAYVYDAANQLKEIHQTNASGPLLASLAYDFNGNLVTKTEGATVTSLTYDALNRMIQAQKTGLSTQTYAYDDSGRRIQKSVGGVATHFLYNGPDIVAEYAAAWGTPTAQYTHGPNTDDPIIRATATSAQYFHQDGLGSVMAVTNNLGGTDATQRFDAWGNKVASTGTAPRYGYTGREPDGTGLEYYRARYYDPSVGRFTQRDPIGLQGGINMYAYVNGNPVNFNDPNGNEAFASAAIDPQAIYAGLKSAWDWASAKYDRAVQIGVQTAADAQALALRVTGGDKASAGNLLYNGQVDAWRHAEWNRRMASDPQVGSTFAAIAGYGHEAVNLKDKVLGNGTPGQTWGQFSQETLMDLSNNQHGREQAELGTPVISLSDPGLVYGLGGPKGQPDIGLANYLNFGSAPAGQSLRAFNPPPPPKP